MIKDLGLHSAHAHLHTQAWCLTLHQALLVLLPGLTAVTKAFLGKECEDSGC